MTSCKAMSTGRRRAKPDEFATAAAVGLGQDRRPGKNSSLHLALQYIKLTRRLAAKFIA